MKLSIHVLYTRETIVSTPPAHHVRQRAVRVRTRLPWGKAPGRPMLGVSYPGLGSQGSRGPMSEKYAFFRVVQSYLEQAARVIELPNDVAVMLSQPKTEITVHFPVRMDS